MKALVGAFSGHCEISRSPVDSSTMAGLLLCGENGDEEVGRSCLELNTTTATWTRTRHTLQVVVVQNPDIYVDSTCTCTWNFTILEKAPSSAFSLFKASLREDSSKAVN